MLCSCCVCSVILHGDAAFSGQGVAYETMACSSSRLPFLSCLCSFCFCAGPGRASRVQHRRHDSRDRKQSNRLHHRIEARPLKHIRLGVQTETHNRMLICVVVSQDLAKAFDVPVLHVNGNDPEAVVCSVCFALCSV